MNQIKDIKYLSKDFSDFKSGLVEFAKNYFPDSYNDFSETSPGMMLIEMASYVGDVLSFYQDVQLQETFLPYTKNESTLYDLAYLTGYRPKVTAVSETEVEIRQVVDAVLSGGVYRPNWNQAALISENSQLVTNTSTVVSFLTTRPVDFTLSSSYDPTQVLLSEIDNSGNPVTFTLVKKVPVYSGDIATKTFSVGSVEKFLTLDIEDTNIVGILDIHDSNSNKWYEVPYLGLDQVYVDTANTGQDRSLAPNTLGVITSPYRFVSRVKSPNILQVQFGSGISGTNDTGLIPDYRFVGEGTPSKISRVDTLYNPLNFLGNKAYGLSPNNTTLTVRYIIGGGVISNVESNTITRLKSGTVVSTGSDSSRLQSISYTNPNSALGGRDKDTVDELKQNIRESFSEQLRAVTKQDYVVRALSMPAKYGNIAKAYITQENIHRGTTRENALSLDLYVLCYNINKHLTTASSTVKNNLKTYMSKYMLGTDSLNILDAFVINIEVLYDIIIRPGFSTRDVLERCNRELVSFFDTKNWSIGQSINTSNIYTLLDKVEGVQTVQNISFINKVGGNYSNYEYDIPGATKSGIVYPSYDPMIFEVKFPQTDIKGRVITL
jgi:hypothetical protein